MTDSRIRTLRKERGLSISKLSRELDINSSILGQAERRQLVPSGGVRQVIAGFFGVGEAQLFGDNGLAL